MIHVNFYGHSASSVKSVFYFFLDPEYPFKRFLLLLIDFKYLYFCFLGKKAVPVLPDWQLSGCCWSSVTFVWLVQTTVTHVQEIVVNAINSFPAVLFNTLSPGNIDGLVQDCCMIICVIDIYHLFILWLLTIVLFFSMAHGLEILEMASHYL